MTLDQLEMVEAIIHEGSFQAAARRLHKSQPSLTNGVKKIEEFYNIELFSRAGYRPSLTLEGKAFFEAAKNTLSSFRYLDKVAKELGSGVEASLTFSIDPMVSLDKIKPVFSVLSQRQMKTQLELQSGVLVDNANLILEQKADFAVGVLPLKKNNLLDYHKICSIDLIPVIHKSLVFENTITDIILQSIPNIIVQTNDQDESNISTTSMVKWRVEDHNRKTELIGNGLGWGRLSKEQLNKNPELIQIPSDIIDVVNIDIFLMRNREKPMGPIAKKIWESMLV